MRIKTIAVACLAFVALTANAAEQAPAKAYTDRQKMIEMHQKMAELHQKAAECLKSGKDVKECHAAMVKECPMAKSGCCPFMEGACPMHGRGMKDGKGMKKGAESQSRKF